MLCSYVRTIYQDADSGFCIVKYLADKTVLKKDGTAYGEFTAKGLQLPQIKSIDINLKGKWEKTDNYGYTLVVEHFEELLPTSEAGIEAYLGSGIIKGLGGKTAAHIVKKFGIQTLEIFDLNPQRLTEVRGISEKKLEKIIASYEENKGARDIIAFLATYGVTANRSIKVYKAFKSDALRILKTEPFKVCEIKGFGFKIADTIAKATGYNPTSPPRIQAGVMFLLDETMQHGNLYLPIEELTPKACELLAVSGHEITEAMITAALTELNSTKKIKVECDRVYSAGAFAAEKDAAVNVVRLLHSAYTVPSNIENLIERAEKHLAFTLSPVQREAVVNSFSAPFSVITGGPGTGKTTILKVILEVYKAVKPEANITLCAPTGRAARKMSESTGYSAATLHSVLGFRGNDYCESGMLNCDLIVVDESSMLDMFLANYLFASIKDGTQVIMVGDVEQLPSVGPGNVLRELIQCGNISVTVLDQIFRQADTSRIVTNAAQIRKGESSLSYGQDFMFVDAENEQDAADKITEIFKCELTAYDLNGLQLLCPFRKNVRSGTNNMNIDLQSIVNAAGIGKPEMKTGFYTFRVGDKVMQTKNTEVLSNGDTGFIRNISTDKESGDVTIVIDFGYGRVVNYEKEDLENVVLAYATTIHKSQGSEYAAVIVPLLTSQHIMLKRNLVYTAITRAKEKVILVGQRRALHMAVKKNDTEQRNTMLAARINFFADRRIAV